MYYPQRATAASAKLACATKATESLSQAPSPKPPATVQGVGPQMAARG